MKYEVVNKKSGHSFGVYEADSEEAAIEAMHRDAGYTGSDDPNLVPVEPGEVVAVLQPERE